VPGGKAIWTGIADYRGADGRGFQLGGISITDLETCRVEYEVPVDCYSDAGRVITFNSVHLETAGDRLRMYAVPDDGEAPGDSHLILLETPITQSAGR
jgi:hypothetical protein